MIAVFRVLNANNVRYQLISLTARRFFITSGMAKSKYEYVREYEQDMFVAKNNFIVLRIDGRGFHRFADKYKFEKPNDDRALELMTCAARSVMRSFHDIILAYGESDEYSFIFRRETSVFDRRSSKLISIVPSLFSSAYVLAWPTFFKDTPLRLADAPCFDARVTPYPLEKEIRDYLSWRQEDCHINNLNNTCIWKLVQLKDLTTGDAQKQINTLSKGDKNELLFSTFNINYNNLPAMHRKGTVLVWEMVEKTAVAQTPELETTSAGDSEDGSCEDGRIIAESCSKFISGEASEHCKTSTKKRRQLTALHVDMNDAFWQQRPHLLNPVK